MQFSNPLSTAFLTLATSTAFIETSEPAEAMTDEYRGELWLAKALNVTTGRRIAEAQFAYAAKCEAAFAAGDLTPEFNLLILKSEVPDQDLLSLTWDELTSEETKSNDQRFEADRAAESCMLKYLKKSRGGGS